MKVNIKKIVKTFTFIVQKTKNEYPNRNISYKLLLITKNT